MKHETGLSGALLRTPVLLMPVFLALSLAGCGGTEAERKAAVAPAPLELARADVIVVSKSTLSEGLPITGTLQPAHQTTLQSRVSAEVRAVHVREGERVQKGQLLARLGTQDLDARLKQAQANFSAAKVEADLTRALAERNRKLFEKKYFAEIEYSRSVGEAEAREENVRAQQALVDIARKAFNDASVQAPMNGIVARRYIEPGSSVGMEGKLFDIVDLSEMEIEAPVPTTEIAGVKAGNRVSFTVSGFDQRKFEGRVVRINPVADAGTRAISVYVRVNNTASDLKGGMYIRGHIASTAVSSGLGIPLDALHGEDGQSPWVLVLKNNKLEKRVLEIGSRDERSNQAFVHAGLVAGEIVVVAKLTETAINQPARISR